MMRGLDGNVHRFKLELSTEHTAAHDPIVNFEQAVVDGVGPKDHRADETVIADAI